VRILGVKGEEVTGDWRELYNVKVHYLHCSAHTWSDSKVRELATMCLPWQHWTKTLVWFEP
jgi:hypothetical protein